jgi:hypothetical protein
MFCCCCTRSGVTYYLCKKKKEIFCDFCLHIFYTFALFNMSGVPATFFTEAWATAIQWNNVLGGYLLGMYNWFRAMLEMLGLLIVYNYIEQHCRRFFQWIYQLAWLRHFRTAWAQFFATYEGAWRLVRFFYVSILWEIRYIWFIALLICNPVYIFVYLSKEDKIYFTFLASIISKDDWISIMSNLSWYMARITGLAWSPIIIPLGIVYYFVTNTGNVMSWFWEYKFIPWNILKSCMEVIFDKIILQAYYDVWNIVLWFIGVIIIPVCQFIWVGAQLLLSLFIFAVVSIGSAIPTVIAIALNMFSKLLETIYSTPTTSTSNTDAI